MNSRSKSLMSLGIFVSLLVFGVSFCLAQSQIIPGGPWVTDNQTVKFESLLSYDQLVKSLRQIEKTSKGLVQLEVIGRSNLGKDGISRYIYMAKIGNPLNTPVMIQTQQHGNEPVGTESAVQLIKFLATGSTKAKQILAELYLLIIVRVNPDGPEFWQRYNDDPSAPAGKTDDYLFCSEGIGWDINRYHFFDWTDSPLYAKYLSDPIAYPYPENPVPESVAVMNAYKEYLPIWAIDLHGQGTNVTNEGESVTSSMLWPTAPGVPAENVTLSKQLCAVMMDHMEQYGFTTLTLYRGGEEPGIARNAYGLGGNGIPGGGSVLVELKGGIGQKSLGMLVKHAFEQMTAILIATADGSLYTANPDRVNDLPVEQIPYYKRLPPNEGEVEPE